MLLASLNKWHLLVTPWEPQKFSKLSKVKYFTYLKVSVSDLDPDPCGSVLEWLPWIQIRIRIGNTDPDPGQSKWCPKRGKNL